MDIVDPIMIDNINIVHKYLEEMTIWQCGPASGEGTHKDF